MHLLLDLTSLLVLVGAVFLLAAIVISRKTSRLIPAELTLRWRTMIGLMYFFLAGYAALVAVLAAGTPVPTELVTGPVFLGGACFVFLVADLSRRVIGNLRSAEESLRTLNEGLEQRVAERTNELRRSHAFLRTVLDSLSESVSIIDVRDYTIVGANAAFLRETGLTEAQIIGRTCYEVTHGRSEVCCPPHDTCPLKETVATGAYRSAEHLHVDGSGNRVYAEVSTAPIRDADGGITLVAHVSQDITARRKAEESLERHAAALEQTNEELKSFIYSVSHDLRAPLLNIKGFSGELTAALRDLGGLLGSGRQQLAPEQQDRLDQILKNEVPAALQYIGTATDRIDGLVNSFLKLSRAGRRNLRPEPIEMNGLIAEVLARFSDEITAQQVAVSVGDLPRVRADWAALEQVFDTLLDNALKYVAPGRQAQVEITASREPDGTVLSVRDNGRGIAADDIAKVFDAFRRVGQQDVAGEGMGLAYARTLVRRHGGRLWCTSEAGTGTTFSLFLPDDLPDAA